MFGMCILRCADGSFYIGHTDDPERRVDEHHAGRFACYTLSRRPVVLVHLQAFETRDEALAAERQAKVEPCQEAGADRRRLGPRRRTCARKASA